MSDRRINVQTGDYISAPGGAFEMCDVLENKITLSNQVALGEWEGDPTLGHRFKEIERAGDTDENLERLKSYIVQAVQWLIDEGELERVVPEVERVERGTFAWRGFYYPPGREPIVTERTFISVGGD